MGAGMIVAWGNKSFDTKQAWASFSKALSFNFTPRFPLGSESSRRGINFRSQVGDGSGSDIVTSIIGWLQKTFNASPPMLQRMNAEGMLDRVRRHPLLDLLDDPNPYYGGSLLWDGTILSLCIDGNGYWLKVRSRAGRVVQLWWVPWFMMEPVKPRTGDSFLSHYNYRPGTRVFEVDPEDVVHFRLGLDPNNPRKGLSPIKNLLREIYTDQEAASWTATLLHNAATPGLIVSPKTADGRLASPAHVQATKQQIRDQFTGGRRGEPLVMQGATEVVQFSWSPEQMNLRSLRQIPEERASAALGVPAAVVGFGTGLEQTKVGATMAQLRLMAYEDGIMPLQRIFSLVLRRGLLSDFELDPMGFEAGFDTSNERILAADELRRAQRSRILVDSGQATVGEGRIENGLPSGPEYDFLLLPSNKIVVPVSAIPDILAAAVAPAPAAPGAPGAPQDVRSALAAWQAKQTSPPETKQLNRAQARMLDALRADFEEMSQQFALELEGLFGDLGARVERAYVALNTLSLAARTHPLTVPSVQVDAKQDPALVDLATEVERRARIGMFVQDALEPAFDGHYLRVLETTVGSVNAQVGQNVNIPDPISRDVIARGGTRLGLLDISGQTKDAIFSALEQGRIAGDGVEALGRRIRSHVSAGRFTRLEERKPGAGVKARAQLIARTETRYAQNVSSLTSYEASEAIVTVMAVDDELGYGDAECTARNGTTFTFEAARAVNEHPNGTLDWVPNIPDDLL